MTRREQEEILNDAKFRAFLKDAFYAGARCIKYGAREEDTREFTNEEKEQEFEEFLKEHHPDIHLKDLLARRHWELQAAEDKAKTARDEVARLHEEIANLQEQIDDA